VEHRNGSAPQLLEVLEASGARYMGASWLDAQSINGSIAAYMTRVGFVFVVDYPPRDEDGSPGFEVFVPTDTENSQAVTLAALRRVLAGGKPYNAGLDDLRARVADAAEAMASARTRGELDHARNRHAVAVGELTAAAASITAGVVHDVAVGLDMARDALDGHPGVERMLSLGRALDKISEAIS
jgi:hypothetical protein